MKSIKQVLKIVGSVLVWKPQIQLELLVKVIIIFIIYTNFLCNKFNLAKLNIANKAKRFQTEVGVEIDIMCKILKPFSINF